MTLTLQSYILQFYVFWSTNGIASGKIASAQNAAQQSEQNIDIIDQQKGDSPSRQEQWYINPSRFYSQYELYLMELIFKK